MTKRERDYQEAIEAYLQDKHEALEDMTRAKALGVDEDIYDIFESESMHRPGVKPKGSSESGHKDKKQLMKKPSVTELYRRLRR